MKQSKLHLIGIMVAGIALGTAESAFSQAPAAGNDVAPAPIKLGSAELETLVAPIALYPDALVAHILPASTASSDVVKAARFLRKNNGKAEPKPNEKWNTSVFVLLQFPEVLYHMDENLDWTDELGRAVIAQQADVMKAIQDVRETAMANGALQSNDKQNVVVKQEVITIAPADPEVIYVPTYSPDVIIVEDDDDDDAASAAVVGFAAGVVVGALLADDDCDWYGGYVVHGAYAVPYGTWAHPAHPYNPRGVADPRGIADPRGVADPRGIADPRGVADPRSATNAGRTGAGAQAGAGGGAAGSGTGRAAASGQTPARSNAASASGKGQSAARSSGGSMGKVSSGNSTNQASSRGRSSMSGGGRGGRR